MRTEFNSCDYCRRRIEPGQWLFQLRKGTAIDTYETATIADACYPCFVAEELTLRDFNLIDAVKVPAIKAASVVDSGGDRFRRGL